MDVSGDNTADGVVRYAAIHRVVDVLAVRVSGEGQQHECAVPQYTADPRHVPHAAAVHPQPVEYGGRAAGCGAVHPPPARVAELQPRGRLHEEAGAAQVVEVRGRPLNDP